MTISEAITKNGSEQILPTANYYDVQDVINAGFTLEPLKCRKCGRIGYTVFLQYVGDAYCEYCGSWQLSI